MTTFRVRSEIVKISDPTAAIVAAHIEFLQETHARLTVNGLAHWEDDATSLAEHMDIGIGRSGVSRALKRLRVAGIIRAVPRSNNRSAYRLMYCMAKHHMDRAGITPPQS